MAPRKNSMYGHTESPGNKECTIDEPSLAKQLFKIEVQPGLFIGSWSKGGWIGRCPPSLLGARAPAPSAWQFMTSAY